MSTPLTHIETEKQLVPAMRFNEFEGKWNEVRLIDIIEVMTDYVASGSFESLRNNVNVFEEHNYAVYVRLTDLRHDLKHKSLKYVDKSSYEFLSKSNLYGGELLVANIGANVGDVYMMPFEFGKATIAPNMVVIRENKDKFVSNFLFYVFNSFGGKKEINTAISGSGQPKLSKTDFKKIKLRITSLPEQQKIASFLSAVDEKIQQLTQKKYLLEQYKKGVMQQLFSGQLRFKDENGNSYPDWEEKLLGHLANRNANKNKDSAVNFVLTNSATQGVVSQGDYFDRDIANQDNLQGYYVVEVNDFVYNPRISVHAPVGPIKRNKLSKGVMSPLYSVFSFKDENLEYFEQYFETVGWHRYLESVSNKGARHDRMNITNVDFFNMPIPYPCVAERKAITNFLNNISFKIESAKKEITLTQTFKKGLLQQMFV